MSKTLSLKARAIALLAQREHSVIELRRKLLRIAREMAQAAADQRTQEAAATASGTPPLQRPPPPSPRRGRRAALTDEEAVGERANYPVSPPRIELDAEQLAGITEQVEQLLQQLQAAGYLSESRFVEARINSRAQRFGNQRIQQELAQHGLSLDAEQQAQLKDSEIERARSIWQRKFGGAAPADLAARAKQTRFLAARGFSAEVIRRLLRDAEN
ncbi:regulatory protein RecX [Paucibacter sp. APW11]|uniref:Regulatory protein RecX n=1 Tax=Roseateles aquae TaxID=3077235 RepID=A0ABU3PEI5_9BURK|nr:regulatory protein RecX [Paucibacter sp. APW11]MDT9001015.1 regulatory protein RecX [Paucibacter sp. APW11]